MEKITGKELVEMLRYLLYTATYNKEHNEVRLFPNSKTQRFIQCDVLADCVEIAYDYNINVSVESEIHYDGQEPYTFPVVVFDLNANYD